MSLRETKYRILIPLNKANERYRNDKGRLFEGIVSQFLKNQSFTVTERVRDVGSEIDLVCSNDLSGDIAVVECKTQTETLPSSVVNKLHTDVSLHDAHVGWIFSISDLGKEAEGRLKKLNEKGGKETFRHFSPSALVGHLVNISALTEPTVVQEDTPNEKYLCIFENRYLWVYPVHESSSGQPIALRAWNAETGKAISPNDAPDLTDTDFPFPELTWLDHQAGENSATKQNQPVVEVIPGEEWSDYRPSRPDDFVGRKRVIEDIGEFFGRVRNEETSSRLFGVKGQSGWGKSSLALKLAAEFGKSKTIVVPVDCRAAKTSIYPNLVLDRAFKLAAKRLYPGPLFQLNTKFEANPFEEDSIIELLDIAKQQGFVICVIFDQFEEIIHRAELAPVFARMKELALAADEVRSNFVVGFSWKTDGTVGSDYPGYHLWHSLSDRRRDFQIDKFSRDDADHFIHHAQRESKTTLNRTLTRFILENYAGFPWLLKKLVKHYLSDDGAQGGAKAVGSLFSLESLFLNDLQEVSDPERRAIKFIAQNSPVDFGSTAERFGAQTIDALIGRRLVINTGGQLNLYWDIFREYILFEELPHLPNTYALTMSARRIGGIIKLLLENPTLTYKQLSERLNVSLPTADNTVRDLVNMGLVRANRVDQIIEADFGNSVEATTKIREFLTSHAVIVRAIEIVSAQRQATFAEICAASKEDYAYIAIDDKTLDTYNRKILIYALHFGVLRKSGNFFYLGDPIEDILRSSERITRISEVELFRAAAPPERVIELIDALKSGSLHSKSEAEAKGLRNAVFAASTLGLISSQNGELALTERSQRSSSTTELVRSATAAIEPFKNCLPNMAQNDLSADEIGSYIADFFHLNWSPGSCKRHGSSFKRWISWMSEF
ncbi:restriction endonuclease [uncultured Roseobacter sp.]|uniref:restriction endonuclease n=1 Tax=uncultured Roseobacter sp. TaxID=114847 RepID=UPI002632096B|nr:restriction endonuclease [uncultured Roseobacter sp.]